MVVSLNMKRRYEIKKRCLQSADAKKCVFSNLYKDHIIYIHDG